MAPGSCRPARFCRMVCGAGGKVSFKRLAHATERPELGLHSVVSPPPPSGRSYACLTEDRGHLHGRRFCALLDVQDLRINHGAIMCTGALSVKHLCACVNAASVHASVHNL